MEALIEQVRATVKNGDENTRKQILNQLRDLSYAIESPDDTVQRFTFSVWSGVSVGVTLANDERQYFQLAALRIGINLNLFSLLPESGAPLTVDELGQKTGADPVLLSE